MSSPDYTESSACFLNPNASSDCGFFDGPEALEQRSLAVGPGAGIRRFATRHDIARGWVLVFPN